MSDLVVVGVDGSGGSRRALAWAVAEARLRGARLRAVTAWSYLDQPEQGFDPGYDGKAATEVLESALAEVVGAADADAMLEIERLVVCDLPGRALMAAAADADLLVVGSRGLGGVKGMLVGSVSQHVANHAPCPVVIVPGPEQP